ncbi:MAG: hypothetical protein HGB08_00700 [Candidatus Moranbacteria bacterium]|nr:hypothetical protein [Candidatus Moranbacteria bacterium]
MSEIIITPDGLRLLGLVLVTCPSETTNGGVLGKQHALELARDEKSVGFEEFMHYLGLRNPGPSVFSHIHKVAVGKGAASIDAAFVAGYFGGKPHIERVVAGTSKETLCGLFGDNGYYFKSIVSHVLLPARVSNVRLDDVKGKKAHVVDAIYENGDMNLSFSNLIMLPREPVEKGQFVLCHHSSVLPGIVSEDMKKLLLEAQLDSSAFMEACRKIDQDGINHCSMLSLPAARAALDYDCS